MSKSVLYATNKNAQAIIATGEIVDLGSIVRRYGRLDMSGGNVLVKEPGYYYIDVNLTFVGAAAGILNVVVYQNGMPIPGAVASQTIADAETTSITIPAEVRTYCDPSTISVQVSGVAGAITNISIVVRKE